MNYLHRTALAAAISTFSLFDNSAQAQSMQFEGTAAPGEVTNPGAPRTEDGFTVDATQPSNSIFSATFAGVNHDGNATDFLGFAPNNVITLTSATSNPFSLLSLDAATLDSGGISFTLNLVGFIGGLQAVTQDFTVTSTWQTFTLSGFDNMESVTISSTGAGPAGVALDNLSTTVVPEPSTVYFLTAAAGLAGMVRLRRLVRRP